MGTASEKAQPHHHAPGSLPCQPRRRACPWGRPPPLHRPPPHLLRPLCHLPRPRLQDRVSGGEGTVLRDQARDRMQGGRGAQPQDYHRGRLPERDHRRVPTLPSPPCPPLPVSTVSMARGRLRPTPNSSLELSLLSPPTTTVSTRSPRCATQSRRLSLPPSPSSLAC